MKRIAVLISGRGSNLLAILAAQSTTLKGLGEVVLVISNHGEAHGLEYAKEKNIATAVLENKAYSNRMAYDHALLAALAPHNIDLIILAGFMRILSPVLLAPYNGRVLNIHPSLLPRHPGLNTHEAVIQSRDKRHGTTVHFVTHQHELDGGPRIAQATVTVLPSDTAADLADRVLEKEHLLYPKVIRLFCEDRLSLSGNDALLDGRPIHFSQDPDPEPEPFERMEEDF